VHEKNSATVVAGQQKFAPKLSNWRRSKAESENICFCILIFTSYAELWYYPVDINVQLCVCLPVCPFVCLQSVHLSVCCLSICLSVCLCKFQLKLFAQGKLTDLYAVITQYIGEFGIVYKAHLVTSAQAMPTFVAVKTLRGCVTSEEFYSRKFIVCVL